MGGFGILPLFPSSESPPHSGGGEKCRRPEAPQRRRRPPRGPWKSAKLQFALAAVSALAANDVPVRVEESQRHATLSNGIISATLDKFEGRLVSLSYRGIELLSRSGGYWNAYGNTPGQEKTERKPSPAVFRVSIDPARNGGALGEVVVTFPYRGQPGAVPLTVEIRYSLHRGDSGLYGWTILEHGPGDPAFLLEQGTGVFKLDPKVFDYLTVDRRRRREMITGEDWVQGELLNLKEARRITTGKFRGHVEHKYDYAALLSETPAYGWTSTGRRLGLWMISPSLEYINGGPIKVELTGHIDGKPSLPADPTLLLVWQGCHYGGRPIPIARDDSWRKVVGPVLLYCNGDGDHEALWADALARAEREKRHWPYAWAAAPGYETAERRGRAAGRLTVCDPQAPSATASRAWVGLAQAPYTVPLDERTTMDVDWQIDGKHYQYWARADEQGRFVIPHVRPGEYTLYAFADGILGDFRRDGVRIAAGETTELGTLVWTPVRYGRPLWEIGIPNRSAEEFRHGDHYWQWGLYLQYPREFPGDVDFVVGRSDWRLDWNYAQPPRPDGRGGWTDTTWRIRFHLSEQPRGQAVLRLAICGVRGGPVDVAVNGRPIGGTGPLPDSGVMHRDGIRGVQIHRDLKFPASWLQPGENVITLTKRARTWTDGVLYDYLRLECD